MRAPTVITATPPTTSAPRTRKSRRRESSSAECGVSPSSGAVSSRSVTIQVISPTIERERGADPGVRQSQHGEQADHGQREEDEVGEEREPAHPRGGVRTDREHDERGAADQQRLVGVPDEVHQEDRERAGREVPDRGADRLDRAGVGAQRHRGGLAQREAGGSGEEPGEGEPAGARRVRGARQGPRVVLAAAARSGSRTSGRPRSFPGSPPHRGSSGQLTWLRDPIRHGSFIRSRPDRS